jgi:hypothetical protein
MNQCVHCELKGNLEECEKVDCSIHDSWYVSALKTKEHFNNQLKDDINSDYVNNMMDKIDDAKERGAYNDLSVLAYQLINVVVKFI